MVRHSAKEIIEELIKRLARAIQIVRIYEQDHQLTKEALTDLHGLLAEILSVRDMITLGIVGNEFAFEKEPLYELSQRRQNLIQHFKSLGVKKIVFMPGIDTAELYRFCQLLGMKADAMDAEEGLQGMFDSAGFEHIAIGDIGALRRGEADSIRQERLQDLVKKDYRNSIKYLTKTFKELKTNQKLNTDSARQIVDGLMKNLMKNKNLLLLMTSMKSHDEDVFEHGVNVAIFTLLQGEMLGIEKKYLVDMGMAAMLHDIGRLSDTVTQGFYQTSWFEKTEKTPEQEEEEQNKQDVKGAKILLETEGIGALPAIAAFEHNIKYDMTGGPAKKYGKQLNLVSMLISISDYYDKMRKEPFYYEEGGPEKAYDEMMKLTGKQFHPDLLNNFFAVMGIYPPGTLVELDSGEIALVIQASMMDIRRPQVEILYNAKGEKYRDPRIVNLNERDRRGQYRRSIVKSIALTDSPVHEQYAS